MPRKRGSMAARRYLRHKRVRFLRSLARQRREKSAPRAQSNEALLRKARQRPQLTATIRELKSSR